MSWLHFSITFWNSWEYSDQFTVCYLSLLFPCGGIQASNRCLLLSVRSGFSKSKVDTLSVCGFWRWFLFWESFWTRVVFFYFLLLLGIYWLLRQSIVDGYEVFKPESMYVSHRDLFFFPIWYFLEGVSHFFFYVIYPFGHFDKFFLFPYFTPKLFCFLSIYLLISPCASSTCLSVEFSLVLLECSVFFVLFDPVSVYFKSSFFCHYFFFIYFFKFYFRTCLLFYFDIFIQKSFRIFPFLASSLVAVISLVILLISHPRFVFLSGFPSKIPNL